MPFGGPLSSAALVAAIIVAIVLTIFSVRYRATWSTRTRRIVFYGEVGLFVTLLVGQIVYAN